MTVPGTYKTVQANGLEFEVLEAGEGDRLALCLHGFPEHAISWRGQIPLLVSLGYRVWAPNQRGYGNSSRPQDAAAYDMSHLLDDVTALIDASGAKSVTLIGHDWGAAVCWFYAMRPARPIERLVIMNVPHPALFSKALRAWKQRARSWYMAFFQLPRLPELALGRDHAAAIARMFLGSSKAPERFTPDVLAVYRDQASRPGALTAMLNWYRAAPAGMRKLMRGGVPTIEIPTLMIWGEDDVALGKETTYGTDRYVANLQLHYLPGVSHWVQQDAPERVNELLEGFLRTPLPAENAPSATQSAPAQAVERVVLPGTAREAPANARDAGACDPNERTTVTIVVRARTPAAPMVTELATLAPAERTYVTREEFAQRYGADPKDVAVVEQFARDAGLTVVESDLARRSVVVEGTTAALGAAFGADLRVFDTGGTTFRGRTGTLSVPASLDGIVSGVFGLDERPQARAHFRRSLRPAATPAATFAPPQVAQAYAFPGGNGAGQTIALIELGGGYAKSDLDSYFASLSVAAPAVSSVGVDGAKNAPTGDPNSADAEVLLDIEVAGSIAPGAKIVVYFAPNTDQGFLDAVTTAIHDTTHKPQIVSISWGGPESSWTAQAMTNLDSAFADAATLGVTVLAAAGDSGSSDGVSDAAAHVDFPASSPHVIACGGTTLQATGATIGSETVWNDGVAGGATGGGISDVFDLPSWQRSAKVPPSANPGGRVGRGVPDVAGNADPQTGYDVLVDGSSSVIGGTSAVAPLWAALVALLNERAAKPLGFANATLYANAAAFNDITTGNNGAYSAGPGWDACTGLGSPNGARLATALAAPASP